LNQEGKAVPKTNLPSSGSQAAAASPTDAPFDPLYTIRSAAEITRIPYWLLLRAVNRGDVRSYQFGNRRKRVRLSDIEAAIAQFQAGAPAQ
jgi:hypothetical protein